MELKFKVKFEDKTEKMMTAHEIDTLKDKRRWIVYNHHGRPIFKKVFKG